MTAITPLTAATRGDLPPPCVSCTFWQHDRVSADERRKAAWAGAAQRRMGGFGRVMHEGAAFRGMVQYGHGDMFPRALALPAGPPGRDAALVTCSFIEGDDPEGACERLLLEALADLKARGLPAVEAFGLSYPDDVTSADRHLGHHTLFDRGLLERLGFTPVRTAGQVALMRIELGGLVAAPGMVARAVRAARGAMLPEPRPAPA
ncbi:MAG: hypothetical protein AB7V62_14635 [Thermoleophilia bacterium]